MSTCDIRILALPFVLNYSAIKVTIKHQRYQPSNVVPPCLVTYLTAEIAISYMTGSGGWETKLKQKPHHSRRFLQLPLFGMLNAGKSFTTAFVAVT